MRRFAQFACFDWSGQAVAKPKGIALAIAGAGAEAPALIASNGGWSRADALGWLEECAAEQADILIGFDFSAALPFADHGAYFPGLDNSPKNARALWKWIDTACADEAHLSASACVEQPELAAHFRYRASGETITGAQFEGPLGRLRRTEAYCREQKLGNAVSCFNLIGAAQVGKSSLTGMRVLHRLHGKIPIWPFDPIPRHGPLLVEIYTGIAARGAGLRGPTKLRDAAKLAAALAALDSKSPASLPRYDDHSTDAILGTAWLRRVAIERSLWHPLGLTRDLAQQEGWTFGVR